MVDTLIYFHSFFSEVQNDIPPALRATTYESLIESESGEIIINSDDTFISEFKSKYPSFSSLVDSSSNPTLSADFDIKSISTGLSIGAFIPI